MGETKTKQNKIKSVVRLLVIAPLFMHLWRRRTWG
jgi:hypothetical protein